MRDNRFHSPWFATAAAAGLLLVAPACFAEDNSVPGQIDALKQQMLQMQQKIERLERRARIDEENANAAAQAAQAAPVVAPARPSNEPRVTELPTHRFGISSADGQNSIELTGRLDLDAGYYLGTHSQYNTTAALDSGFDARRARIGVTGRFMGDWTYALIYDFGNTSDTVNINNYTAQNVHLQPAYQANSYSALSGLENASVTYSGLFNHGQKFPIAFDLGYMDVPSNLDEATSSNDIMFMERSSAQVVQTEFGGGDFRAAFGARSNSDRYWAGVYLTGPQSGALHTTCADTVPSGSSSTYPLTSSNCDNGQQMALVTRASYQLYQDANASLHIGVNNILDFQARNSSNAGTLNLYDRPELRIDPTIFLVTCSQASSASNACKGINSSSGDVAGLELAGAIGGLYGQAEFYHYIVNQDLAAGEKYAPTLDFNGGYAELSYSLGGTRHYIPATGAYSGVIPEQPLSFSSGGWGAIEIAARYSGIDLNSHSPGYGGSLASTGGVEGGFQQTWSIGLNYYPNDNMRFMLDFLHVNVGNRLYPDYVVGGKTGDLTVNGGVSFNAIAARTQIDF